ncbi:MAG: HD domain-containing protein [Abditibacteriota bacterium]|nr:HD domain-containing protein [Abditibacteriota bacterium]
MNKQTDRSGRHERLLYFIILCLAGLLINFVGAHVARMFSLPIWLDVIGNILAAALGGPIPAIVVGFTANLINSIGDISTAYYSFVSLLISIAAAWFAGKKAFSRPAMLPLVVIALAFIGGVLGSCLTWILNGYCYTEGISGEIAKDIGRAARFSPFLSHISADFIIDLFDKAIQVAVTMVILQLIPAGIKKKFRIFSARRRNRVPFLQKILRRQFSLRDKVVAFVVAVCLLIASFVTYMSYDQYRKSAIEQQIPLAYGALKVAKRYIDADRINEYMEQGEKAEGYTETKENLAHLMNSTKNIEYVYVYKILPDGCHVVFDPDTADTPGEKPGAVIPFDEAFMEYVPDLLEGKKIDPIESNERYGWLLTLYEPIRDSGGVCQCYAGVDINLNFIDIGSKQFLAKVFCLFWGLIIVIVTLVIWLADSFVIFPINAVARATGEHNKNERPEITLRKLEAFEISTGDEIQNLHSAVKRNLRDIVGYIEQTNRQNAEIQAKSERIEELQAGLIDALAIIVESREEITGEHVKKTRAYTDIIMRQLLKDGQHTDVIDDDFMRGVKISAAMHDIGKIKIPETILNKTGKLTDEEFAEMKQHTTSGASIIDMALNEVNTGDSDFLKHARDLALYHHEKWNGKGYPTGLAGEDIPLAARIMAVADVFDALVSKRPYKKPMSYEQAMEIITKDSGTHFDPVIVNAFVNASDEVRETMKKQLYNDITKEE